MEYLSKMKIFESYTSLVLLLKNVDAFSQDTLCKHTAS